MAKLNTKPVRMIYGIMFGCYFVHRLVNKNEKY